MPPESPDRNPIGPGYRYGADTTATAALESGCAHVNPPGRHRIARDFDCQTAEARVRITVPKPLQPHPAYPSRKPADRPGNGEARRELSFLCKKSHGICMQAFEQLPGTLIATHVSRHNNLEGLLI